ncbi:hypothetical protein [uncultured Polaribacter sp.]|nr:hypothetical protein [uncultured Polaribacter sp.]
MKKTQQHFLAKIFNFSKKSQTKRQARNYADLVENFKTKVQLQ